MLKKIGIFIVGIAVPLIGIAIFAVSQPCTTNRVLILAPSESLGAETTIYVNDQKIWQGTLSFSTWVKYAYFGDGSYITETKFKDGSRRKTRRGDVTGFMEPDVIHIGKDDDRTFSMDVNVMHIIFDALSCVTAPRFR